MQQTNDIKKERIEQVFQAIAESRLIYLPKEAISIFEFHEQNVQHRKKIGKWIKRNIKHDFSFNYRRIVIRYLR